MKWLWRTSRFETWYFFQKTDEYYYRLSKIWYTLPDMELHQAGATCNFIFVCFKFGAGFVCAVCGFLSPWLEQYRICNLSDYESINRLISNTQWQTVCKTYLKLRVKLCEKLCEKLCVKLGCYSTHEQNPSVTLT